MIFAENEYHYVYVREMRGVSEDIHITSLDSSPFGEHLPLYSAYLGYRSLDEVIKEEIAAKVYDKRFTHSDEININTNKIRNVFSSDKLRAMIQRARMSISNQSDDIIFFLVRFCLEIKVFD